MSATLAQVQSDVSVHPSSTPVCITSDSFRVHVTERVFSAFARLLRDDAMKERGLFLLGEIGDDEIRVESHYPFVMTGDAKSVRMPLDLLDAADIYASGYGLRAVGDVHSHPNGALSLSEADHDAMVEAVHHLGRPWVSFVYGPRFHDDTLISPWLQGWTQCWVASTSQSPTPYRGG